MVLACADVPVVVTVSFFFATSRVACVADRVVFKTDLLFVIR